VNEWINDECAYINIRDWFTLSHPLKGESRNEISRVNGDLAAEMFSIRSTHRQTGSLQPSLAQLFWLVWSLLTTFVSAVGNGRKIWNGPTKETGWCVVTLIYIYCIDIRTVSQPAPQMF
jgi:hypothetical protein